MSDEMVAPDGLPQSPAERAARVMYRLGLGYDIDADESVRATMIAAADQILRSSGIMNYDPVTKVILENRRRHCFEWLVTPRWQLRARRRKLGLYLSAVDRLTLHVQDKVLLQEVYAPKPPPVSPTPTVYDRMCDNWGVDPEQWPSWFCSCGQRHAGWSLFCERCNTERNVACPQFSTHGGSGWAEGTYTIGGRYEIVCGSCGSIFQTGIFTPRPIYIPTWVQERKL